MKKGLILLVFIILFSGCAPTLKQPQLSKEEIEAEREKQREIALLTYFERQERLYRVGLPLLKGALNYYNKKPSISFGIIVHTKNLYEKEDIPIIRKKYVVNDIPSIIYLHPDFGGFKGGLKINDKIIEIDGKKINNLEKFSKVLKEIDLKKESVEFVIEREGERLKLNIPTTKICPFSFHIVMDPEIRDTINAYTDGERIFVTPGLLRFIQDDNELAIVLSHEIAHAVLEHVQKTLGNKIIGSILDIAITIATGINTQGVFGTLGGLVYSKEFEKEADYLGTYIAAVSGYDITNAANIWRKLAAEYPGSTKDIFLATHPSSPERYVLIENTVKEIKEKQEKGLPLKIELKK